MDGPSTIGDGFELGGGWVAISADITAVEQGVLRAEKLVADFVGRSYVAKLDIDTSAARASLSELEAQVARAVSSGGFSLGGGNVGAHVGGGGMGGHQRIDIDTSGARQAVQSLGADVKELRAQLELLSAAKSGFTSRGAAAPAALEAEIATIQSQLTAATPRTPRPFHSPADLGEMYAPVRPMGLSETSDFVMPAPSEREIDEDLAARSEAAYGYNGFNNLGSPARKPGRRSLLGGAGVTVRTMAAFYLIARGTEDAMRAYEDRGLQAERMDLPGDSLIAAREDVQMLKREQSYFFGLPSRIRSAYEMARGRTSTDETVFGLEQAIHSEELGRTHWRQQQSFREHAARMADTAGRMNDQSMLLTHEGFDLAYAQAEVGYNETVRGARAQLRSVMSMRGSLTSDRVQAEAEEQQTERAAARIRTLQNLDTWRRAARAGQMMQVRAIGGDFQLSGDTDNARRADLEGRIIGEREEAYGHSSVMGMYYDQNIAPTLREQLGADINRERCYELARSEAMTFGVRHEVATSATRAMGRERQAGNEDYEFQLRARVDALRDMANATADATQKTLRLNEAMTLERAVPSLVAGRVAVQEYADHVQATELVSRIAQTAISDPHALTVRRIRDETNLRAGEYEHNGQLSLGVLTRLLGAGEIARTNAEWGRGQAMAQFGYLARADAAGYASSNEPMAARATAAVAQARMDIQHLRIAGAGQATIDAAMKAHAGELHAMEHAEFGYRSGGLAMSGLSYDQALLATGFGMDLGRGAADRRAAMGIIGRGVGQLGTSIPGASPNMGLDMSSIGQAVKDAIGSALAGLTLFTTGS